MKSLKYKLFFTLILIFNFTCASAGTSKIPPMDGKFGLGSISSSKSSGGALPQCDSLTTNQAVRSMIRQGYCIGEVLPYKNIPGISLVSEERTYDGILMVIARNPALVGLAKFLKICRPLDGLISDDGILCMYKKSF